MAIKPIALSFKNTPEDIDLYEWIIAHSNLSGFIKDILKTVKGNEIPKMGNKKCEAKKPELIDMEF